MLMSALSRNSQMPLLNGEFSEPDRYTSPLRLVVRIYRILSKYTLSYT
jgi:hypothetical protein